MESCHHGDIDKIDKIRFIHSNHVTWYIEDHNYTITYIKHE